MKAIDLQLGDYVHVNGGVCRVESISPFDIRISDNKGDFYHKHTDNLQPIHLTAEILTKNGFNIERHRDLGGDVFGSLNTYWLGGEIGTFRLQKYELDDEFQFGLAKIKYVHELQHALRLCGIEKEIEL